MYMTELMSSQSTKLEISENEKQKMQSQFVYLTKIMNNQTTKLNKSEKENLKMQNQISYLTQIMRTQQQDKLIPQIAQVGLTIDTSKFTNEIEYLIHLLSIQT